MRQIKLFVTYGSWRVDSAIHLFTEDGRRWCDGHYTRIGLGMGKAGDYDSLTCKKCKRLLERAESDPDFEIIDGWDEE